MSKPIGGLITLSVPVVDLATGIGATIEEFNPVQSLILRAGTDNSGDIFIGGTQVSGTTDTWMVLEAGDGVGFDLANGNFVDLANINVKAASTTTSDTVYVFGIQ